VPAITPFGLLGGYFNLGAKLLGREEGQTYMKRATNNVGLFGPNHVLGVLR